MRVTKKDAFAMGTKLGVNFDVIPLEEFQQGMMVEMEHGKRLGITNVSKDNLLITAKIALAHFLEYPDYYRALEKMEARLHAKWKGKRKPSVLIRKRSKKTSN